MGLGAANSRTAPGTPHSSYATASQRVRQLSSASRTLHPLEVCDEVAQIYKLKQV